MRADKTSGSRFMYASQPTIREMAVMTNPVRSPYSSKGRPFPGAADANRGRVAGGDGNLVDVCRFVRRVATNVQRIRTGPAHELGAAARRHVRANACL